MEWCNVYCRFSFKNSIGRRSFLKSKKPVRRLTPISQYSSRMSSGVSISKTRKCVASVEYVFSLDELLTLILLPLAVKKLMRLKLVSPRWKKLITSFEFSQTRNPNPNPPVGLFFRFPHSYKTEYIHLNIKTPPINPPLTELYFPNDPDQYWIQHSCKGLLVCCTHGRFYYKGNKYPIRKCYIYNPTTKQFWKVPIRQEKDWFVHGVALSFDHKKKSNPFNVYAVGAEFGTRLFRMEKYSRESGEWSFCGASFRSEVLFNYPTYWNDTINWIDYSNGNLSSFNVVQETISHIAGPVRPGIVYYFGESCDHLLLIKSHQHEAIFNIYEMRADHSEWFVKYRIDISNVARALGIMRYVGYVNQDGKIIYHFSVFAVVMGKNVEESFVVLRTKGKVIMYYFLRGTFEEITLDQIPTFFHFGPSEPLPWAVEYIESLVSF